MIRSPQHRKKGTQMPGLFAGEEGDDEKVEALVEYLASLKAETPKMPAGDAERGKELYHKVGCVACHEPALDVRPPKVPADAEVEKPGNASVPIALADAYEFNALAAFLRNPLHVRAAGRMPDMRLSEQEASDLAAYLHMGRIAEDRETGHREG
jgi:cytochrome c1